MEEWLQKGVEDWKQNMVKKKEREAAQLEFEYKQAEKYNKMALTKIEDADREVNDGISKFEQTLQSQGINPRVTKEQADFGVSQSFQQNTHAKTFSAVDRAQATIASGLDGSLKTKTGAFTLTSTKLKHRTKMTFND